MNPLLEKELRTRLRGRVIFIIQNIYLFIIAGAIFFILLGEGALKGMGWAVGRSLFSFLTGFQAFLLSLISVSLAASAITLEKAQKTYDMLLITPLRHHQIIQTKLVTSVSYVFVLLTISIPLICLSYILGGISSGEIFWAYLITFLAIFLFGSIGVWSSTLFERSQASVPISIIIAAFFLLGPYFLLDAGFPSVSTISPLCALTILSKGYFVPFYGREIPFWVPSLALSLGICSLFVLGGIERLKLPSKRSFSLRNLILLIVYLVVLILLLGSPVQMGLKASELKGIFSKIFCFHLTGIIILLPLFGLKRTLPRGSGKIFEGRWFIYLLSITGVLFMSLVIKLGGFNIVGGFDLLYFLGVAFSFSLVFSLLAKLLSARKRPRSIAAKTIFLYIVILAIVVGPILLSLAVHHKAKEPPSSMLDFPLVFSPYFSQSTIFTPKTVVESFPALAGIGDKIPLVSVALYLVISFVLAILCHAHAKKKDSFI